MFLGACDLDFITLRLRAAVQVDDLVEHDYAEHYHQKATQLAPTEGLVPRALIDQEEGPDENDACLVHDDTVGGAGELSHVDGEAVEQGRRQEEHQAEDCDDRTRSCLLCSEEDIVYVSVDALEIIERACKQLGWDQKHQRDADTKDPFPANKVQSLLATTT